MNMILCAIKNILLLILTVLVVKFTMIFGIYGITYFIFLVILGLILLLSIIDIIKKRDITLNKTYNIISIVMLLIMIFIFARALFDQNFLFNSGKYVFKDYPNYVDDRYDNAKIYVVLYLYQNLRYFIVMMFLTLLYRGLNKKKEEHKYHWLSVICLLVSIYSIISSLSCMYGTTSSAILYLLFTLGLIGIEVYRLIKDNYKKREWIIYLSFLFNTFALMTIIINLFLL